VAETYVRGSYADRVQLADAMLDVVANLEAEIHPEEVIYCTGITGREWQMLDRVIWGMLERRGADHLSAAAFLKLATELGEQVKTELQAVIDVRTDAAEESLADLNVAKNERDPRVAFRLYIETAICDAAGAGEEFAQDFETRVMGALKDELFDQQEWLKEWEGVGVTVPAGATYADALVALKAVAR
jgi:hypothetical protein